MSEVEGLVSASLGLVRLSWLTGWRRALGCWPPNVKILVLTNLYPPHHAGTYDFRCETVSNALRTRGHTIRVLTSKHGMGVEQRRGEVERCLLLNGVFEHPPVTRFGELRALELRNHQLLREAIEAFEPDVIHVYSLA